MAKFKSWLWPHNAWIGVFQEQGTLDKEALARVTIAITQNGPLEVDQTCGAGKAQKQVSYVGKLNRRGAKYKQIRDSGSRGEEVTLRHPRQLSPLRPTPIEVLQALFRTTQEGRVRPRAPSCSWRPTRAECTLEGAADARKRSNGPPRTPSLSGRRPCGVPGCSAPGPSSSPWSGAPAAPSGALCALALARVAAERAHPPAGAAPGNGAAPTTAASLPPPPRENKDEGLPHVGLTLGAGTGHLAQPLPQRLSSRATCCARVDPSRGGHPSGQYAGRASAPTSPGPPPPARSRPVGGQVGPGAAGATIPAATRPVGWRIRWSTPQAGHPPIDPTAGQDPKAAPHARGVKGQGQWRAAPQGHDPAQQRQKTGRDVQR